MSDAVRRIIREVSHETLSRLFDQAGLKMPADLPEAKRARTNALHDAVSLAEHEARTRVEVACERVAKFQGPFANFALRRACHHDPALMAICDAEQGIIERSLLVLLRDGQAFVRAASLVHNQKYRQLRDHDAFRVKLDAGGAGAMLDLRGLTDRVMKILRAGDGSGRKIEMDPFSYPSNPADPSASHDVHHIAVFAQGNAAASQEFLEHGLDYVVRRPAHEISIDLDPETGRLDIAGRGIGGKEVRARIAAAVALSAGAETAAAPVTVRELVLNSLIRRREFDVSSVPGLLSIELYSLTLEPPEDGAGEAKFTGGPLVAVWERMRVLGLGEQRLDVERVQAAELTLHFAATDIEPERSLTIGLTLPNRIDVSSLGMERRVVLDDLLPALGLLQDIDEDVDR